MTPQDVEILCGCEAATAVPALPTDLDGSASIRAAIAPIASQAEFAFLRDLGKASAIAIERGLASGGLLPAQHNHVDVRIPQVFSAGHF